MCTKHGEDKEREEEQDLDKLLEDMEIPDFNMSTSIGDEDGFDATESSNEDDHEDYGDRLKREEILSKRYHPTKSERKELEKLSKRIKVSSLDFRLTTCQKAIHKLLFGNHSIIIKKGTLSFNGHDCELFLLTDGFVAVRQTINPFNLLESRYVTCQLWSSVNFVEIADIETLKIELQSGESFEIRSSSDGEDVNSWLGAIEHVLLSYTIHNSGDSTTTDELGWQYKLIRKAAYTTAVTANMALIGNPDNLNELDKHNQYSPLHYAVQYEPCSADVVDALLSVGCDPNFLDGEGRSAMYYAQTKNLKDIEDLMTTHGGTKSKLAEIELKGELFAGIDQAKKDTAKRREIEQTAKEKATEAAGKAQTAVSQMSENMAAMIERGEKIDAVDNKAQRLNDEAREFRDNALKLRNEMKKKKNKKWFQF